MAYYDACYFAPREGIHSGDRHGVEWRRQAESQLCYNRIDRTGPESGSTLLPGIYGLARIRLRGKGAGTSRARGFHIFLAWPHVRARL